MAGVGKPFRPGDERINRGGSRSGRLPDDVRQLLEAGELKGARQVVDALDATKWVGGDHPFEVPDWSERLKAAGMIFDRLRGKPAQAITGEDGERLNIGIVILPAEGI